MSEEADSSVILGLKRHLPGERVELTFLDQERGSYPISTYKADSSGKPFRWIHIILAMFEELIAVDTVNAKSIQLLKIQLLDWVEKLKAKEVALSHFPLKSWLLENDLLHADQKHNADHQSAERLSDERDDAYLFSILFADTIMA